MTVQKVLKTLFEIAKFETSKLLFKFSKLLVQISFALLPVRIPYRSSWSRVPSDLRLAIITPAFLQTRKKTARSTWACQSTAAALNLESAPRTSSPVSECDA